MKQRLLYITHHQLDQNNGGCNASKGFLRCFAALFDEGTVISHDMADASLYIPSHFKFCPMQDSRSKVRKLLDMYRGAISGHYYFVREHLKEHQYDVVVIDHSFTGAGLPEYIKSTGAKLITIHHNVERDYLRDNSKEKPLLYRGIQAFTSIPGASLNIKTRPVLFSSHRKTNIPSSSPARSTSDSRYYPSSTL